MSDHVEELKKVKVPLWSIWLGRYRSWKRRQAVRKEVRYIATVTQYLEGSKGNYFKLWYVLKERGDGERFYEASAELDFHIKHEKSCWCYNHIVLPWMLGHWENQTIIDWVKKQKAPT